VSIVVVATTTIDLSSLHLSPSSSSFYLWHSRLGHVSSYCLRFLTSTRTLENLQTCDIFLYCNGCKLAKFSVLPFNWRISISSSSSDLIYSDVWRPSLVAIKRGSWCYVFLLMIILIFVGFIYWNIVLNSLRYIQAFELMSKLNILLLSNDLGVMWVRNTPLINFVNCLPYMKSFTKLHVHILLGKMELLKENIDTLSKLLILSCFLLLFLVSFGEKLSLLL